MTEKDFGQPRRDVPTEVVEVNGAEHEGKFYFKRAFFTIFGGLMAGTLWALLPAVLFVIILTVFGTFDGLTDPDPSPITSTMSCDPDFETC